MHTPIHIWWHISTATCQQYSVTLCTCLVIHWHIDNRLTAVWCAPGRESLSWQSEPTELLRLSGCISVCTSRVLHRSHWLNGKLRQHHEKRASLCASWLHRLLAWCRLCGEALCTGVRSTDPVFRCRLFAARRGSYWIVKVQYIKESNHYFLNVRQSVRPSVHMAHLACNWTDFYEILYCGSFRKHV